MTALTEHRTVHRRTVSASPEVLYGLVADVTRWPVIFGPTVHAEHLERGDRAERFRLWALVNGTVASWTSRRRLDPDVLRIDFRQEASTPPIASMGGDWHFRERPGGHAEVVLGHDFTVVDDDPDGVAWVTSALHGNSDVELGALARLAEAGHPVDDLVLSFEDVVPIPGTAADVFDFVNRADLWPERLPHVSRLVLTEDVPGVQHMEMETVTEGGHTHTTSSVRLCFRPGRIVYKQLVPPKLLLGHSGAWEFADGPGGAVVTAHHTVAIDPAAVEEVLGAGKTVADARQYVRTALGANSTATLAHAAAHAAAAAAAAASRAEA
jgi:ribosome-associated toxin RatA of RatAB toxin-antitoxin module